MLLPWIPVPIQVLKGTPTYHLDRRSLSNPSRGKQKYAAPKETPQNGGNDKTGNVTRVAIRAVGTLRVKRLATSLILGCDFCDKHIEAIRPWKRLVKLEDGTTITIIRKKKLENLGRPAVYGGIQTNEGEHLTKNIRGRTDGNTNGNTYLGTIQDRTPRINPGWTKFTPLRQPLICWGCRNSWRNRRKVFPDISFQLRGTKKDKDSKQTYR